MRDVRTNFLINIGGMVLPLLCSLITVPIYIHLIGAARYGVLSVVWLLLGYFGFLDFGLSRASANALSRLAHATAGERVPVLVTSLYLNLGLGAFGGVVLYAASSLLLQFAGSVPAELRSEIEAAMPWIAFMLPVALVSAVGSGALESRERFMVSNTLTTVGGLLGQVGPVVCAWLIAPSLSVVIPAAFLSRLFMTGLVWLLVIRDEGRLDLRLFERHRVRGLLGYGAWVSVTSIISPLVDMLDQVLIGALLGPAAVAHYAVPMNIATRSQVVSSALSKTLFPRLSRLGRADALLLAERSELLLASMFAAICGPAVILAGPALKLWVGPEFAAQSIHVAQILMVGAWCAGLAFIPFTLIQGQGRPDITARIHMAEAVPFIAVLWVMITHFGLIGAAWAWTLRVAVDALLLLAVSGFWSARLLNLVPPAAAIAACWGIAASSDLSLPAAVALASVVGLSVLGVTLRFNPIAQNLVADALPRRLRPFLPGRAG